MEIKSEYYPQYLSERVKDIPSEHMRELVDEFAINAKFYMSSDVDNDATDKINTAVVELLKNKFSFLPLSLIAEAYTRGSLGELGGTTRFTVRNIYIWLAAVNEKSQRLLQERQSKIDDERRASEEKSFRHQQKRSNLYGAALYKKIEWCYQGLLNSRQYDELTLDMIVAKVEAGYDLKNLTPSMIL